MILVLMLAAFAVALFTLFTGFGLGTLLLPFFALVLPPAAAVAATAVVHGLNNLFKLSLLMRHVDRMIIVRFGVPAVLAAVPGAWLLTRLAAFAGSLPWTLGPAQGEITAVKLALGLLILAFAYVELSAVTRRWAVPPALLPLGGLISGFFGGLSGHQGAFRAAFLGPLGLAPEVWAGTQAAIAVMVDATRIAVYGLAFAAAGVNAGEPGLLALVTLSAFAGSYVGRRLLHKTTVAGIRVATGVFLVGVGVLLVSGLV